MTYKTKRRINKGSSLLQKLADGIVSSIELVVTDAFTPKRVRRHRGARR